MYFHCSTQLQPKLSVYQLIPHLPHSYIYQRKPKVIIFFIKKSKIMYRPNFAVITCIKFSAYIELYATNKKGVG